ncbi:C45 family peptidase [Paenalcaligenes niemegkensis]|uniref:C45 family autoproteolytic acyltransferase/hydolase n=1 Tax=Paenalcaligenes niemegkensis TaxID=2895469 RepID=UPI001EE9A7AB|nr:C45 family peptidase [Paenalcaligenes niemegkensis]MCQ9617493.1 C45 family peptidase [Paenalcaligenes niemegkensis]
MATLKYIEINGTAHEVGVALGRFGHDAVHNHLLDSDAWKGVMQWRHTLQAKRMQSLVQQNYPRVWQELLGLAQGLGLPFDDVFLWNCRGDLWAMAPDGCTTVQLPHENVPRITHNEDGDPGFAGSCGLAYICSSEGASFISFLYPGSIPGHTIAVNEYGLAMTVNNVRALGVEAGVPRMVLTRQILEESSLESAVAVLQEAKRSGAFHLSLGMQGSTTLLSVEFSQFYVSALKTRQALLHANHAVHDASKGFEQRVTASSEHRQKVGTALLSQQLATGSVNPLTILADNSVEQFPIFRKAADDSDDENTLATADIRLEGSQVLWEIYTHPLEAPVYRFRNLERLE